MKPKQQPIRLEAVDDRPCHDQAAREIVRQARERAAEYPTEAHDSKNRAARGLTYFTSIRKPEKEKAR